MKRIELNLLNKNQRKLLRFGVVVFLALFLIFFFFQSKSPTENNQVTLEDSKLQVFDDTYTFNGYPNRILVHYPYFIFVQANKPLTIIYNLETKQKEKEIKDVLLDYFDGNIVYNREVSYFNDISLGEFCDSAFIKSTDEILCITKRSRDSVDNHLINIDPAQPNLWKQEYESENILTTVSVINNTLHIGEINFKTKENYISVNEKILPVENTVNLIYEMNGKSYFASFKSELNGNREGWYLIEGELVVKQGGKIVLYMSRN